MSSHDNHAERRSRASRSSSAAAGSVDRWTKPLGKANVRGFRRLGWLSRMISPLTLSVSEAGCRMCRARRPRSKRCVVPLLQVLGYDVFDPREVRPEYVADFAVKKAGQFEKIDYTICVGGLPVIFVECKALGAALEDHSGQLSRYFNSTPSVRVAWITDGVRLRVFTDLHQPNIMDVQPWLSIDLLSIKPAEIDALRRFRKADFSPSDISALAEEMVYYSATGFRFIAAPRAGRRLRPVRGRRDSGGRAPDREGGRAAHTNPAQGLAIGDCQSGSTLPRPLGRPGRRAGAARRRPSRSQPRGRPMAQRPVPPRNRRAAS